MNNLNLLKGVVVLVLLFSALVAFDVYSSSAGKAYGGITGAFVASGGTVTIPITAEWNMVGVGVLQNVISTTCTNLYRTAQIYNEQAHPNEEDKYDKYELADDTYRMAANVDPAAAAYIWNYGSSCTITGNPTQQPEQVSPKDGWNMVAIQQSWDGKKLSDVLNSNCKFEGGWLFYPERSTVWKEKWTYAAADTTFTTQDIGRGFWVYAQGCKFVDAALSKKICVPNPNEAKKDFPVCYCEPNSAKNKVAVIVKAGGLYDNPEIGQLTQLYFYSVAKDVQVESAGIRQFIGSTISELDAFIDNLYIKNDVGYILLVGDDLPVAETTLSDASNQHAIYSKLECVNADCEYNQCRDIAISYILPPVKQTDKEKIDFIESLFSKYAAYHNNPQAFFGSYEQDLLRIKHVSDRPDIGAELLYSTPGYRLPVTEIFNSKEKEVASALKKKHLVLKYDVHGSETMIGMGLNYQQASPGSYDAFYTTVEEYLNFVRDNGLPSLFVDAGACQATTIKADDGPLCCWPQAFLKSGVWAYYSILGGGDEIFNMENAFSSGVPIGKALRQKTLAQNFIFGDILAHFPLPS